MADVLFLHSIIPTSSACRVELEFGNEAAAHGGPRAKVVWPALAGYCARAPSVAVAEMWRYATVQVEFVCCRRMQCSQRLHNVG